MRNSEIPDNKEPAERPGPGGVGQNERRAAARYSVGLDLNYTIVNRGHTGESGRGHTIDLSSCGLSFIACDALLVGQKLDVSLSWPVLLDGKVELQLRMAGVIVRTDGTTVGMRIHRHEFRTRRVVTPATRNSDGGGEPAPDALS